MKVNKIRTPMQKLLKLILVSLLFLGILQSNVSAVDTTQQTAFIERFYQNILDRTADTEGMNTWLDVIQNQSATQVAMGFLNSQEFNNLNPTNDEFLDIMYQTMFDRVADDGGKADWLQKMNDGRSKQSVMFGFFKSQEFKNLTDSFGVTQILPTDSPSYSGVESYVNRFYNLVLKREPDDAGFDDWVKQLTNKTKSPIEIASGFLFSQEYQNQNEDNSTFLDTCYKAFFGRDADDGGKTDWLNKLNNQNYTKEQIFEGFTGSQEFANLVNGFNLDADSTQPVFTSSSTITVEENQTSVITVSTTDDSDVRYTLEGLDKDSFNIDSNTGVITFINAPDYETKDSYSIVIRAIDALGNVGVQSLSVGVSDVNEIPIIAADDYTNIIANAHEISLNTQIIGDLETSNDMDYFKFTLNEQTTIEFERENSLGNVGVKDTFNFDVYNSMGTKILNEFTNSNEKNILTLNAGTYYINVNAFNNYVTGYQFILNATSGTIAADDYTNIIANAHEISLNTQIIGDLETSNDMDYFKFTLNEQTTIEFERENSLGNVGVKDTFNFDVYNSMGTKILNEFTNSNEKNILTLNAGTYYINVNAFNNYVTGYQFILNATSGTVN
jgi:hypothetical protein